MRKVFLIIKRTARDNKTFTVDHVWAAIERAVERGTLDMTHAPDHRILGPMMKHVESIRPTGYYMRSTRRNGGYRPVSIWEYTDGLVAV
jgi:hypothetical protein